DKLCHKKIDLRKPPYQRWIGVATALLIVPIAGCQVSQGNRNIGPILVATEAVVAVVDEPEPSTETPIPPTLEPTQQIIQTPLPTNTSPPVDSPDPTATDLPTDTPTINPSDTPNATKIEGTPLPSATATEQLPTSTPLATATAPQPTATSTVPASTPTVQVTQANAKPELVEPADHTNISQEMYTFIWRWPGPALAENQAFEVRIWREGEPHFGAFDARETAKYLAQEDTVRVLTIPVSGAYSVQQNGNGEYFWSVAVVQLEPYQLVVESDPKSVSINLLGDDHGGGHGYQ
ncbi:MAG: hypothetical protein AAF485_06725, partial [Chloroflexota bacterium]